MDEKISAPDGKLAEVVIPKRVARKAKTATPASGIDKGQKIRKTSEAQEYESVATLKAQSQTVNAIRKLTRDEALAGFSLFAMTQIADSGFTLKCFDNGTNILSEEATEAAKAIVARLDTLTDYSKGYSDKPMLQALIQTLLRESPQAGGIGVELVIDKNQIPEKIQIFDYNTIDWLSDGNGGRKPQQKVQGGDPVDLNLATIFIAELHKGSYEAYATPILKSALTSSVANNEFVESMRRAVFKSGHSRVIVQLDAEKVRQSAPVETQDDSAKLATYMEEVLASVQDEMSDLEPDDCLVSYDSAEFKVEDIGGSKSDYVPMMKAMANLESTGLKTPPSIIGVRADGSQSLSNSETLVYLKVVKAVQTPVEEVLSRALTLALRMFGFQAYCRFEFKDIDLRPQSELEAFTVQKQTRLLELLSLGKITDYEFCIEMGLNFNPDSEMLSGTKFYSSTNKGHDDEEEPKNNGGMERTIKSDSPKKAGGKSQ